VSLWLTGNRMYMHISLDCITTLFFLHAQVHVCMFPLHACTTTHLLTTHQENCDTGRFIGPFIVDLLRFLDVLRLIEVHLAMMD